jgi:hypothetical protein
MNLARPTYPSARDLLTLANVALSSPVHDNLDPIAPLRERPAHGASAHPRSCETVVTRRGVPPERPDRGDPAARALRDHVVPHAVHAAVKR